jgi:hypothetical protein
VQVKTCEICGQRAATFVCQECGRKACKFCFETTTWVCLGCHKSLRRKTSVLESFRWSNPSKLLLLGFVLMFVGIIVIVATIFFFGAATDAGVVIWIFPLPPIGYGTGPYAFWTILFGIALTVPSVLLFSMLRKKYDRVS